MFDNWYPSPVNAGDEAAANTPLPYNTFDADPSILSVEILPKVGVPVTFAYGTLDSHVEMGEEIFYIERNAEGEIYYKIEAFSRPNKWFTKIAYPVARAWQRRFVRESFLGMKAATTSNKLT